MPRGTTPEEILERLEWVKHLPESAWSSGIIDPAESLCSELDELSKEKIMLDEKIRARLKVLRLIPARAEREAKLMYDASDVAKAKNPKPVAEEFEE